MEKLQNMSTKNGNGAHENVHMFKSNAPLLLKLGAGLDHMNTKGWMFFAPAVCFHGIRGHTKVLSPKVR